MRVRKSVGALFAGTDNINAGAYFMQVNVQSATKSDKH
jgi:hypothetical protein